MMRSRNLYKEGVSRSLDKILIILFILLRRFGPDISISPCTDPHKTPRDSTASPLPFAQHVLSSPRRIDISSFSCQNSTARRTLPEIPFFLENNQAPFLSTNAIVSKPAKLPPRLSLTNPRP